MINGIRIGNLQVDEDLGSTANFSIAKAWLHECQTSHSTCQLKDLPRLPTRVVDVGLNDLDAPCIITSNGVKASYVALSHCWGGKIPVLLTTETIADFQKALPLPDLSQNFRDAIKITQRLGIRFLWIDSLCILQNSKSDWQFESRQMGRIYRDSTLTIYAAASDRSTAGILCQKARQYSRLPEPAYIALWPRPHDLDQQHQRVKVSWVAPEGEEDLHSIYHRSPLYSRGWCLQESILAPRQLIYGARQLYWRCQATYQSADGTPEGLKYPEFNYKSFTSLILSDILTAPSPFHGAQPPADEMIEAAMKDYYDLVETYNLRTLTYGSDKLPAFSGLARLLQPILPAGTSYLAGLWSTDIHHGLLWRAEFARSSTHIGTNPYRAPSWSWAVTDTLIHFPSSRSEFRPNPLNMELLESHVTLQDPEDSFGEIVSAVIRVRAHVIKLVRSSQVEHVDVDIRIGVSTFDHEDERAEHRDLSMFGSLFPVDEEDSDGTFILSIRTEGGEATEFVLDTTRFLPEPHDDMLIMLVRVGFDEKDSTSGCSAECLILQRTKENIASNRYERFGVAELYQNLNVEWLMSWDSVVLDLI